MVIETLPIVGVAYPATRAEKAAARLLQTGIVVAVVIASRLRVFDLDRFFVPKELLLHVTAAMVGVLLLGALRRVQATRVDVFLLAFLLISALSAAFAINPWAAFRAFAISASGVAIFWSARALREANLDRGVVVAVAFAAVLVAASCLLQAYGVSSAYFSTNRSPGGTLGNRNFVAHLVAFCFPVLLVSALRAWRGSGFVLGALGASISLWALVLTRSRAAWLALIAVLVVMLAGSLLCRAVRRDRRLLLRTGLAVLFVGAGAAAAVTLPNALTWRSDSPYLETARGVVNFREGSGRGRLIQYGRSIGLLARNPLLGVGPGNWQVMYPALAPADDPSLDGNDPGLTANPWPSSDWVAMLVERGVAGAGALGLALVGLVVGAWRRLRSARDADEGLCAIACLAMIAGTVTAGAFDAVMLLGWPALLVWAGIGALWTPGTARLVEVAAGWRMAAAGVVVVIAFAGVLRSTGQWVAMSIYADEPDRARLELAARADPGNLRVRLAAARNYGVREAGRCEHAVAARGLHPESRAVRRLVDRCDRDDRP